MPNTRWHIIPTSRNSSLLFLLVGIIALGNAIWQLVDSGGTPILVIISLVLAVALIVVAIIGLVSPRLRGR